MSLPEARPDSETVEAPSDPLLGRVLDGRYSLLKLLGRGGMGAVYEARQTSLGRVVAVKVIDLRNTPTRDPNFEKRFMQEAEVAANLDHPAAVRLYDYGVDGPHCYLAMELLDGESLFHRVRDGGPIAAPAAAWAICQVAEAAHSLHEKGLIHRDLKPDNIFLTDRGTDGLAAKLLDFGLVKDLVEDKQLTHGDVILGAPEYISPEHALGRPQGPRSDVYSLGLVLYFAVCGRPPYQRSSTVDVLRAHVQEPPPPFERVDHGPVDLELEAICHRAMATDPDERFWSMAEFAAALREFVANRGGPQAESGKFRVSDPAPAPRFSSMPPAPGAARFSSPSVSSLPPTPPSSGDAVQRMFAPFLLGFGAMTALGLVALLILKVGGDDASQAPALPAVVLATPVPATAAPEVRTIELVSTPSGAQVHRDGAIVGTTPLTVPRPDGDAVEFTVSAPGHDTARVLIMSTSPDQVSVELSAEAARRHARPRARRSHPTRHAPAGPVALEDPWQ